MEITEINQLELPDKEYFELKAVSNSRMSAINPTQGGSLKRFFSIKKDKDKSSALENGTYVHLGILEPEKFVVSDIIKPTESIAKVVERMFYLSIQESFQLEYPDITYEELSLIACNDVGYNKKFKDSTKIKRILEAKEYYEHLVLSSNSIVMTNKTYDTVMSAVQSIKNNEECMKVLQPDIQVFNEIVITCNIKLEDIELPLKGKIDNYTVDYKNKILTLNDLKTTGFPIHGFMGYYNPVPFRGEIIQIPKLGNFQKNRYYRQIAFYLDLLVEYFFRSRSDKDEWTINCNIIAVETTGDFESKVLNISNSDIEYGRKEYKDLLVKIAKGIKDGYKL